MCADVDLPPLFVVWPSNSNVCITELGPVWTAFHEAVIKTWVKCLVKCYILIFHKFVKQFMVFGSMAVLFKDHITAILGYK